MTPDRLARELNVSDKTLRAWLRRTYARPDSEKGGPWDLTTEQVNAARGTFAGRRTSRARHGQALSEGRSDWFWEGAVQAVLVDWLTEQGWTVESVADTATKERGDDIRATRGGRTVRVEVKGWPTTGYADPARAAETKRTNPTNQASHWLSQAILHVMRDLGRHPDDLVGIGLPDWPRFRKLLGETDAALRRLGIGVLLVHEDATVEELLPLGS